MGIYDITVTNASGEAYQLDKYKGQPMVIVNTATKCGLRGQFDGLEKLYDEYKDKGLVVLGFPSDQFGQEVSDAADAASSCRMTYGVTFPMHDIIKVNGKHAHPLFQHLTAETKGFLSSGIKWNFTKFLVDQNGDVVGRFAPKDSPDSMRKDIQKIIGP